MIWLVDADGGLTAICPADLTFPGVREYAEGCLWMWSLAQAWDLAQQRRKKRTP